MKVFIEYVGPEELHDATIQNVRIEDNRVWVTLQSYHSELIILEFLDVSKINAHRAEGMLVYALSEMKVKKPYRGFVFANWDEEDNAMLEIVAKDFRVVEAEDKKSRVESKGKST